MRNFVWIALLALVLVNACKKDDTNIIVPVIEAGKGDTIYIDESYKITGATATHAVFILWSHNGSGHLSDSTTLSPTYYPGSTDADQVVRITLSAQNDTSAVPVTDYIDLLVRSVADSLTLGAGYANEVYYSFANGIVKIEPRANWDIAFCTEVRNSTIITNGGNGVKLYTYPTGDTANWGETLNTSGMDAWKIMYNADTTWTYGAFEANTLGYPDYGWGIYDILKHDVVGDSIFIISLPNSGGPAILKKIDIERKHSTANTYYFKYANLDGTDEHIDSINCSDYTTKNFVYFSLMNNDVVDREPANDSWDFVFTKYIRMFDNTGTPSPYPVTGVLLNRGLKSSELVDADPATVDYSGLAFSTNTSGVGYDWKSFNGVSYDIKNKLFFIKKADNIVYRLKFTGFDMNTGLVKFERKQLN